MGQGQGQNGVNQFSGELLDVINSVFGSFDVFKQKFEDVVKICFGLGWVWLVVKDGKFDVVFIVNQDNLLMGEVIVGVSGILILGVDVWEYVYYFNYQNCCFDYFVVFWNVVNWDEVLKCYVVVK